jgi:two-component system OmpR family response regulator
MPSTGKKFGLRVVVISVKAKDHAKQQCAQRERHAQRFKAAQFGIRIGIGCWLVRHDWITHGALDHMTHLRAARARTQSGRLAAGLWQNAGACIRRLAPRGAHSTLRASQRERAMGRSIAIVEDEPLIRANYVEALNRFGYDARGYGSRQEASSAFAMRLPELVIIDIGLGDEPEGGFDLCRELRAKSSTLPLIFLTARDSDFDVISGLRLGADDYLSKDTSLHQLAARIAALFRRIESLKAPASSETVIEHGPLKMEAERMRITWKGEEVPLTVTEFWMVHTLIRFPAT